MSATDLDGRQLKLPRELLPLELTDAELRYAGRHPGRTKRLAVLQLRELLGWEVEMIARVFEHSPGTVSRQIEQAKRELAELVETDRVA